MRKDSKAVDETQKQSFYKSRTLGTLVFRSKSKVYYHDNPNPAGPFRGKDGKCYEIIFPDGNQNSYYNAMGWTVTVKNPRYGIPGFLVGRMPDSVDSILELVTADLAAVDRNVYEVIEEIDIPEELPKAEKNTCWIKIYFSQKDDWETFHFARKDEKSGRWIHRFDWEDKSTVVCDFEYEDYCKILMKENPEIKELMRGVPVDAFCHFAKKLGLPKKVITKAVWQSTDGSGIAAFDPEGEVMVEYNPKWVMRIDCN